MTAAEDLRIEGIEEVESLDVEGSAIYRARQPRHNRTVAIKMLDNHHEPLLPKRFDLRRKPLHRFAEDPGVVSVYNHGTTPDGRNYLIMPYFRIGSLADQVAYGPMPWHRASELVMRAAETVAKAHEMGVALGDLKPSRLLLADASSPLIAVYGMATRRFDDGRPTYAAPEAQLGAAPSPAADVFSLCLTMAALIVGRAPNRGPLSRDFLADLESTAPTRIVELIKKGIAEDRLARHNSGRDLANEIATAIGADTMLGQSNDGLDFDLDALLAPPPINPALAAPPLVSATPDNASPEAPDAVVAPPSAFEPAQGPVPSQPAVAETLGETSVETPADTEAVQPLAEIEPPTVDPGPIEQAPELTPLYAEAVAEPQDRAAQPMPDAPGDDTTSAEADHEADHEEVHVDAAAALPFDATATIEIDPAEIRAATANGHLVLDYESLIGPLTPPSNQEDAASLRSQAFDDPLDFEALLGNRPATSTTSVDTQTIQTNGNGHGASTDLTKGNGDDDPPSPTDHNGDGDLAQPIDLAEPTNDHNGYGDLAQPIDLAEPTDLTQPTNDHHNGDSDLDLTDLAEPTNGHHNGDSDLIDLTDLAEPSNDHHNGDSELIDLTEPTNGHHNGDSDLTDLAEPTNDHHNGDSELIDLTETTNGHHNGNGTGNGYPNGTIEVDDPTEAREPVIDLIGDRPENDHPGGWGPPAPKLDELVGAKAAIAAANIAAADVAIGFDPVAVNLTVQLPDAPPALAPDTSPTEAPSDLTTPMEVPVEQIEAYPAPDESMLEQYPPPPDTIDHPSAATVGTQSIDLSDPPKSDVGSTVVPAFDEPEDLTVSNPPETDLNVAGIAPAEGFAPPTSLPPMEEAGRPEQPPLAPTLAPARQITGDEQMPFRSFDRQHVATAPSNRFFGFVSSVASAVFNRRRSFGGLLAFMGFAAIAGIVGVLIVRDLRAPASQIESSSSFSTVLEEGSPSTFAPTSEAPVFIEPPATHETTTTRRIIRTTTTAPTTAPPTTPAPTTRPPTTATTRPPTTGTTRPPTTRPPTTRPPTTPTTRPPTTPTTQPPTTPTTAPPTTPTSPPTTPSTSGPSESVPEGPPVPLIEDAAVSRVRATTARVSFDSSSCVTATFTYSAPGISAKEISGGSRCSRAHTLLLGTVTPSLSPGTTYTVTIEATDARGRSSRSQLSFTTLG